MRQQTFALGFYQNVQTAENVLKTLRNKGFRRSASLTRTVDDHYLIDSFSMGFGLSRELLHRAKQWIIREETLVLVQIPREQVRKAINILRHVESGHPTSFLLYPEADEPREELPLKEPLTTELLNERAKELAALIKNIPLKKSHDQILLTRILKTQQKLYTIRHDIAEAEFVEQTITLSAEWLLDNMHVIEGTLDEIHRSLPKNYYEELPKIAEGPWQNMPRTYIIAQEIIHGTTNKLNLETIIDFINSYQTVEKLTIGELWALPLMLRIKLLECIQTLALDIDRRLKEGELASFWGNRLLNVYRKNPENLPALLTLLDSEIPSPSAHFAEELLDHIFDEETILPLVRNWLETKFSVKINDVIHQEQIRKTAEQVALSNAIVSLITLSQLSWREVFEKISSVDAVLNHDPAGIYPKMSFATRDTYRHSVEVLGKSSQKSESEIAEIILQMAKQSEDPVKSHVGYYLIDEGRPQLEKAIEFRPSFLQRLRRGMIFHPAQAYLGSIILLTLIIECASFYFSVNGGNSWQLSLGFILIALIPVSELAIQLINLLFTQLLTPFVLPKMNFEQGIPQQLRTLTVIPMLLSSKEEIEENLHRLEVHYLANSDPNIYFGLLTDFLDAPKETLETDAPLLQVALDGIASLQNRYGPDKFFLFHRPRTWNEKEKIWMGWERKRGKLEELNRYLTGCPIPYPILKSGQESAIKNISYVLTLDADTYLPKDTARQLIETLAHPLNSPQFSPEGEFVRGYTIIQPRVSTHFSRSKISLFTQIFSDVNEVNPYSQAVSDIYQDLSREGCYHGKGLYDLQAFHRILTDRFPENHLLSHDLLEGAYARVGFASNVVLFDYFPDNYLTWSKRQHRWMRGDWQIIDWLSYRVTNRTNKKIGNTLSLINRWKIFDNLRRALLPVSMLMLLISAWFLSAITTIWTPLVLLTYFMPTLFLLINKALHPFTVTWEQPFNSFLRGVITIALLPHQAYLSLDALFRVLYRRTISHRKLLEWNSASTSYLDTEAHKHFLLRLGGSAALALIVLLGIIVLHPSANIFAATFCILWTLSPLIVYLLDKPLKIAKEEKLSDKESAFLRLLARKTWRFFDEFVGPQTHWLPPDNYQAALEIEVAQRTSPTNIGLWILSVLSAYDFKYIAVDTLIQRVLATLQTINKLERYEGHLLNWYNIQNLQPLYPRYVSTVDNGNLIASLWTFEQGFYQLLTDPIISTSPFTGMRDTFEIFWQEEKSLESKQQLLSLKKIISECPKDIKGIFYAIHKGSELLKKIAPNKELSENYWLMQIEKQFLELNELLLRYFPWIDSLDSLPTSQLKTISPSIWEWREKILHAPFPSLHALASEELSKELDSFTDALPAETQAWLDALKLSISMSEKAAQEKLKEAYALIEQMQMLSDSMNLKFLYNAERKVFSIGYHVDDRKLDASYYDLLASEARTASLVAIARGDAPLEHWWALGRPYKIINGLQVLQSWGGTMFEYMMPLLFTKLYPFSLLEEACKAAVTVQINYGNRLGIPWGISESAFSEIDIRKTYQYRSFGVPGLGLKRGLENDLVISPYSSALALPIASSRAVKNLQNLKTDPLNAYQEYGYYESIDFTRQKGPLGERGVIVYAYMAHHQGMSFIAFNNAIHANIMPERFHADPRISGVESLLFERTPLTPAIAKGGYRKETPLTRLMPFSTVPIMGIVDTPHTPTPKVNLLSNGNYSVMVTNSGGGYSTWNKVDITRWRSDTTCDTWGSFFYIKDRHSQQTWSASYSPVGNKGKHYSVSFKADKVEIKRRDNQIETSTEIVVSPEDNVEVRLMTLVNLSTRPRSLEITSYQELVLAPHATDRSHPCFNKLFIETEALTDPMGLLAFRRLRSPEEPPIWALHTIASSHPFHEPIQYETNRYAFIGRGHTLQNPKALEDHLSNSQGTVLDPIFSLRCGFTLQPGERVQISFITGAAETREQAVELIKKYSDLSYSPRAIEMAWTHAQLELRHLRIHQEESQLFQKLASRVLYPHSQLRPPPERLRRNCLGQSRLWVYGISGDLPIIVLTIADVHELDLLKQVLTAHAFWRMRGLQTDLIILNEQTSGYNQPLREQVQRIIHANSYHSPIDKPGGIFLRNADQIPEEDLTLIFSVSRANLVAARGSLRQQLVAPLQVTNCPLRLMTNKALPDYPSSPLPFVELDYFNGTGGYTPDGKEYVIYLGPNTTTPAPWINVIANPLFGTIVSDQGSGSSWYGNSQTNRLTPWSNDPVLDPNCDVLYIRDEERGVFWTATPAPIRELDAYRIRHGQGYTRFEHNSHGIEQNLTIFVPVDGSGGLPLKIQKLTLKNCSPRPRQLSITAYAEWVLGSNKEESQLHVITEWDLESQALFAYNRYHPDYGSYVAFTCSISPTNFYTADRTEFLGRNNSLNSPAALKRQALSGMTGPALDPCSALQLKIDLNPGEEKEAIFIMGYAPNAEEARKLIQKCRESSFTETALATTKAWWDHLLETVQVQVPDKSTNFACNRWLLYQVLSCRFWGRSAFYQSSGAYGFRDQLQDVLALLYSAPELARAYILKAAAHQFIEGDVQHWWHPPSNAGVRTRISDDLLWLPFVTAQYVRVTNDLSILQESIPFLKGPLLADHEHEAYFIPEVSEESAPLLEHCRRAIYKGNTAGPQGLPLIGCGDWNDGMNRVGIHGKGESVWLGWFLIHVMNDFGFLLEQVGQIGAGEGYRTQAKRLAEVIENKAWDGNWYCRAYFDDGTPLGSRSSPEGFIDAIAQSWAIISSAGDPSRAMTAMNSVDEFLIKTEEQMVLLLTPPFDKSHLDPGYIKGYPPGVRENGGQYTHGCLWTPLAFARRGEGDKAVNLMQMIEPTKHARTPEEVERYKVEPYILAADIYSLPSQMGRGGWTWYTGSAGVMYRIWLEDILGFTLRGQKLTLNPNIPTYWNQFSIHYRYHNTHYQISVENPFHVSYGSCEFTLDGVKLPKPELDLTNDGKAHTLQVKILQN